MALSCSKMRVMLGAGHRTRRHSRCIVRAQTGSSSTTVLFRIHRHVEFGQSLLLVGSVPELGTWDAKQALELNWGEGDNWSTSITFPVGSAVEYKYVIKRRDGLDWCPGQNKAVSLPSAASVQVTDTWENPHGAIATLAPLEVVPVVAEASVEPVPAAIEEPAAVEVTSLPEISEAIRNEVLQADSNTGSVPEAVTAVSTVENLHVPELEKNGVPAPAVLAAQHQQPPGLLANNIVQGVLLGAVAVGSDPITQYEEADKYQVVEVGLAEKTTSAAGADASIASSSASISAKSLDKMTMSELRTEVKRRGMSPMGNRRELLTRLENAGVI